MADDVTDPDLIESVLTIQPTDVLIVRINPDRFRSRRDFDEYCARVKTAIKGASPDSPTPIVIAADQLAVRKPEATS
jgi:hypothetical protein